MDNKIFSDSWLQLSKKEKKSYLEGKLLGLHPVIAYLDDEPEALEIFSEKCAELGVDSFTTSNPEQLIDFISKNKSRLLMIVSDYRMPQFDGVEFRRKSIEISPEAPFYILSGYVDRQLALQGIELKISGFISKPLHKEGFLKLLQTDGEARAQIIREEYEMLKSFTDDVVNIISEIEEGCLTLENDINDHETVSRIFGLVHTVKGSSGFFEPRTLHLFAHALEDKLKLVQSGQVKVTTSLITTWLQAIDIIKSLNEELATGLHKDHDIDELKKTLEVKSEVALERSEIPVKAPVTEKYEPKEHKGSDVKVPMKMLDDFTQVSGELTVIRNMINKVVTAIEKQYPADKDVQILSELLDEMHKINSEMQFKISDIRRVSVEHLIKPLSRNLRDTSKALGKEVEFVVEGSEVRLDNAIADTLSRCLIHLMRNSLDHGLENEKERLAAGKSSKGKLKLKFSAMDEVIIVSIEDDGRGINTSKIREKILTQGMKTPEQVAVMSDDEVNLMIFESGFSTAAKVSEFSGRGVGMSMVKEEIELHKGKIIIQSTPGKGSKFILEIPIPKSVLIVNCLFVSVGNMIFGLPQDLIIRVFDLRDPRTAKVETTGGSRFFRFKDSLTPVISLSKTLGMEGHEENHLVVLESQGVRFALGVDDLHDTEDTVIKPLTINALKSLGLYLGGTFLNDGRVGLIIDVAGLASRLEIRRPIQRPVQEIEKSSTPTENVITFALTGHGTYGIQEKDILRIENILSSDVYETERGTLVPYRDSIMTLIHIEDLFPAGPRIHQERDDERMLVLITKHKNNYLGLVVREIRDLITTEMSIIPSLKKRAGVKGSLLHKEEILTLIDVSELCLLLDSGKENESDIGAYPAA